MAGEAAADEMPDLGSEYTRVDDFKPVPDLEMRVFSKKTHEKKNVDVGGGENKTTTTKDRLACRMPEGCAGLLLVHIRLLMLILDMGTTGLAKRELLARRLGLPMPPPGMGGFIGLPPALSVKRCKSSRSCESGG